MRWLAMLGLVALAGFALIHAGGAVDSIAPQAQAQTGTNPPSPVLATAGEVPPASAPAATSPSEKGLTTASAPASQSAEMVLPVQTADDAGAKRLPGGLADTRTTLGEVAVRLVIVLVLAAAALIAAKKFLPRLRGFSNLKTLGKAAGGARNISVIETAYLGPRKTLHLVQVGDRKILLASSGDTVTMLCDLEKTSAFAPGDAVAKAYGKAGAP